MSEQTNRANVLLKAAYDLLREASTDGYVRSATEITVFYDEGWCDGECLMNDIEAFLEHEC